MTVTQHDQTRLIASGFVVVRTPLLSMHEFETWAKDAERAWQNAKQAEPDYLGLLESVRRFVERTEFAEAIQIASPVLAREINAWLQGDGPTDARRLLISIAKYLTRASFRPTPFGLFAGCTLVESGESTKLKLAPRSEGRRYSRIDSDHLALVAQHLRDDPTCRRRLPLYANTTAVSVAGRLNYVETRYQDRKRHYVLTAADQTPEVAEVLARARHGALFDELAQPLLNEGFEGVEVEQFIDELIDAHLLIPDVEPSITGGNAAQILIDTLNAAGCAPDVAAAFVKVSEQLRKIDEKPLSHGANYREALQPLYGLATRVDESRLLQVDLYKPTKEASLGSKVISDAIAAVDLLARTSVWQDPLASFASAFEARYETREVRLLEALDDEVGLGFPVAHINDGAGARADVLRRREAALANLRYRAAVDRLTKVELSEAEIRQLTWPDRAPIPDAMSLFGSLIASSAAAIDRGDYHLAVTSVNGPSGVRMLGRFAHLDPTLEARIREHLASEEELSPDVVFPEVVHLPQGRIGNVTMRPVLREYELPYLGRSGAPIDRQLNLDDLWLSVDRGRLRLRSLRLDREVRPRLTSAHSYANQQHLPVYRFLCSLQDHQCHGSLFWNWGAQSNAPFLPRITRGRVVLTPARWSVSEEEIISLSAAAKRHDLQSVRAWQQERSIPRLAVLADGDNRLPVDFESSVSTLVFLHAIRGRKTASIAESLSGIGRSPIEGVEGEYANEIVVPLVRRIAFERAEPRYSRAAAAATVQNSRRVFAFGSTWVYAKLYCGSGRIDGVLRDLIAPLIREIKRLMPSTLWFFVRYADPEPHIRLRFQVANVKELSRLTEILTPSLAAAVESGVLSRLIFDTYAREVERYGGPDAITIAESIFEVDSNTALSLLTESEEFPLLHEVPRELALLAVIDRSFSDANVDHERRILLLERALGSVSSSLRKERGLAFRRRRVDLEMALSGNPTDVGMGSLHKLLDQRTAVMGPLLEQYRKLDSDGRLHVPFVDILFSLLHMCINRAIAGGTKHEPVLYDYLQRIYRSYVGRYQDARHPD